MKIKGGYYIKARCIQESEIQHAPPHVREIWDWFMMQANHTPYKKYGNNFERGQLLCTYANIQEALHWTIGWRKKTYSKSDCETAMKWLKKRTMVATRKTTKGMIVTICNYDYFQNPKNYETYTEAPAKATGEPQTDDSINKKNKNEKNGNGKTDPPNKFIPSETLSKWFDKEKYWKDNHRDLTESCFDYFRGKGEKKKDWEAVIRNWCKKDKEYHPDKYKSNKNDYNYIGS